MGSELKKLKLASSNKIKTANSLIDICDWTHIDNIAIEYHDLTTTIRISYAELNESRLIISNLLVQKIKEFEFIGINFDIPVYCIPSLITGISSSGFGFVYLSNEQTARHALIRDLCTQYVFSHYLLPDVQAVQQVSLHGRLIYLIKLDDIEKKIEENTSWNCFAYGIASSGSTGMPKIVKVPHICILPNIQDLKEIFQITSCDKIAQMTNFTFDPSIIELFLSLSTASTLYMASTELKNTPDRLLQTMSDSCVTILQTTPSLLLHRWALHDIRNFILNERSNLRILLLGGECFPKIELISQLKHPENITRIFNIYGTTEVSCWASINEIALNSKATNSYDLGTPLSETVLQVRNEMGSMLDKGEGFLYIGSSTRVCALDDEIIGDLKCPIFRDTGDIVTINKEGKIFYKGRHNKIIKRFGNKLDLQVLSNFVLELHSIQSSYCFWDETNHKLHLCVCVLEKETSTTNIKTDILTHIEILPKFYKPDKIHFLEDVKVTVNGKICPSFLERICMESKIVNKTYVDFSYQNIYEIFENVWKDFLKSTNEGFLSAGGTSIEALQISATVTETFGVEFPELIGMLLRNVTYKDCITYLNEKMTFYNINDMDSMIHNIPFSKPTSNSIVSGIPLRSEISGTTENTCLWYKCRGRVYTYVSQEPKKSNFEKQIIDIQVKNLFGLEKCVDASPAMYKFTDEKLCVTVASHAGVGSTVKCANNDWVNVLKIKLPDRVEASFLVLNNFKGIVGCYDHYIYCVHLKTGDILWKFQTKDIVKCTGIACKDQKNIFVGSYDRHVYCLSVENGSQIWSSKISEGSISATGCLHPQSSSILFGTLDGSCVALTQLTGTTIWKHKLPDPVFVAPLVLTSGLVIFCSVAGALFCFDIQINQQLWMYKVLGNIFAYPLLQYDSITKSEYVIVASRNKQLYCLELNDVTINVGPILKYAINCQSPIFATPWCEDDIMTVACTDGSVLIYSFTTGELLAKIKLGADIFSSPVMYNDIIALGCRDNNLYILQLICKTLGK